MILSKVSFYHQIRIMLLHPENEDWMENRKFSMNKPIFDKHLIKICIRSLSLILEVNLTYEFQVNYWCWIILSIK